MGQFSSHQSAAAVLQARIDALVALFVRVGATRMDGVPILNPALQVVALGFEVQNMPLAPVKPAQTAINTVAKTLQETAAVGILITPWFMNLVWFPLVRVDAPGRSGSSRQHTVGAECFDFCAGHEPSFGSYEACSLFSPMFEFPDQAAAVATAQAVLDSLRCPAPALPAPESVPAAAAPPVAGVPDRRAFLFGRRAVPSGATP
jgi:[NiFe] hydrogenase assembly HybE family chaperone